MLKLVRASFFILFITVTILSVINVDNIKTGDGSPLTENYALTIIAAVVVGALIVAIDIFTPRKKVAILFAVFFALMGGLMVAGAMGLIVDLLARLYEFRQAESAVATLKVLVGICVCYLAIAIVLQTQDDFRLVIPYVEFAKQIRGVRPMLLDSSALIDGRIAEIAATGVLQAPIVVPRFVVAELQTLADSGDRLKRARGRRGLSIVTRLQKTPGLDVSIDETQVPGKAVDQLLVDLAQSMPATIVTTDVGLARVADIQRISVLNINTLAAALRAPVAAGDRATIRVVKHGEQPGQGVGYLEDGTMIVVEGGGKHVGEDLPVVIGTSLQTAGGRLIFAKPAGHHAGRGGANHDQAIAEARGGGGAGTEPDGPSSPPAPGDPGQGHPARPTPAPDPTGGHQTGDRGGPSEPGPFGPGGRRRATPRNPRR